MPQHALETPLSDGQLELREVSEVKGGFIDPSEEGGRVHGAEGTCSQSTGVALHTWPPAALSETAPAGPGAWLSRRQG